MFLVINITLLLFSHCSISSSRSYTLTNRQHYYHHSSRQSDSNHYVNPSSSRSAQPKPNNEDALEHFDRQSNIHFHYRPDHQSNCAHAPSASNLRPADSPSLTRRTRDDSDDNDGFTTVSKSKKHKPINSTSHNNDFISDSNQQSRNYQNLHLSDSPDPTYSNTPPQQRHHHRYPTRYQVNHGVQQRSSVNNTVNTNDSHQGPPPRYQQQQYSISTSATRYAQTRYPFSPFIIRFNSGSIKEKQIAEEIVQHFKNNDQFDLQLTNVRLSTKNCTNQEYDCLIFAKNADSFCALFSQSKWPQAIGGERFTFLTTPSFPAQLALVVKNVDLRINLYDFTEELMDKYVGIHKVIRLKNKFQNDIKLVKLELLSTTLREELLRERRIKVNSMVFDIDEYLSPADVLICSKCCGIGHFKKQCKETNETCKTCGVSCPDLRQHVCSQVVKCIHCGEAHLSNSRRCPIVKDFRAALTKNILLTNRSTNTSSYNSNLNHDPTHYPLLPPPPPGTSFPATYPPAHQKFDELLSGINEMKGMLGELCSKQNEFENFMKDKIKKDELIANKIEQLIESGKATKDSNDYNSNIIVKFVLPTLDLISQFLYHANLKSTNDVDPDFKLQIELKRKIIDRIISGKQFSL
ncbi:unnamed protein product [Adineta ricciae]|uniref:Gag-like protein n=1 Tax=Adineta ricciae TaxID=249248 RepID=A0A814V9H1_ADIRI|nr:unnamed protein product [Adineta ricciae]